jgi:hypothetical protein
MNTGPLPAPQLIANTRPEDATRDKLYAHVQNDPNWIFDTSTNETEAQGDAVRGSFLIYRHRLQNPPVRIAIPAPNSGPTYPEWREGWLCVEAGYTINAIALHLDTDTNAIAVDRLTQIAMLTAPGAEPTPELLAQIHHIATTFE